MFSFLIIIITITLAISLYRALIGPTLFDRLLAANIIGTTTVLFLVMYGYLTGRTDFLDIAIAYILMVYKGPNRKKISSKGIDITKKVKEAPLWVGKCNNDFFLQRNIVTGGRVINK